MTARRKAREDALQILYQLEMNHDLTPEAALYYFERHFLVPRQRDVVASKADVRDTPPAFSEMAKVLDPFTQRLVTGVTQNLRDLDASIAAASEHWRTGRMPVVDRNILRIGVFELNHCDDVPATVTINEMVEVAKQFGSENSAAFVNGVLDKLKAGLNRPSKVP